MSFLKITDPKKRNLIVNDYLKTKEHIKTQQTEERTGERDLQKDLGKLFRPITDVQKSTIEDIRADIKPINENISQLKTITFPAFPSIEGVQQPDEDPDSQFIGPIAQEYLRKFATKTESDKTYGLYYKSGSFYIGNKPVIIVDDNIVVDGEEYQGTAGLWELIVTKTPDPAIYTDEDYDNYAKLMVQSNALKMGNDPESNRPKSSKAKKWRNVLKPIWEKRRYFEGSGTGSATVIIPCDPNALLERLDLLMASKAAGNTGVRNELVSICDELKRQNIIDANMYKKIMSSI